MDHEHICSEDFGHVWGTLCRCACGATQDARIAIAFGLKKWPHVSEVHEYEEKETNQ